MSDVATPGRRDGGGEPFRARTMLLLLAIGIIGFAGMLVLGAYAPDLRTGRNGGAHALSDSAVGYSGIVRLAAETGRHPRVIRSDHDFGSSSLLVVTPESGSVPLGAMLEAREGKPTLVVLPKWATAADPDTRGWVRRAGPIPRFEPETVLAPGWKCQVRLRRSGGRPLVNMSNLPASIAFAAPRPVQVIAGIAHPDKRREKATEAAPAQMIPLLTDGRGGIVLARLGDGPLYVLADPDLLANQGMKDARQAASALALLDWLNGLDKGSIGFDVTTNGLSHSPSPLKLAFDPPFLAMTLSIVAVLILVGIHAFGRFGAPARRTRALAFGKRALVDNSAAMIRRAGYEARLGDRYAAVIRERAAATFGVPSRLRDAALDAYLDGLGGEARFSDLARAADAANDRPSLVAAARALHIWYREKLA
jgi:hypothetical protein